MGHFLNGINSNHSIIKECYGGFCYNFKDGLTHTCINNYLIDIHVSQACTLDIALSNIGTTCPYGLGQ